MDPGRQGTDPSGLKSGDAEALARLREILRGLGSVAVAFSGGVDSSLLLAVAAQELGDRALAVTATSPVYPGEELEAARAFAAARGIAHLIVASRELELPGFADNPTDRCYHCKHELFALCREAAAGRGLAAIADATNLDDLSDYRPGLRAGDERGVCRPLVEAGFDKARVRRVSKFLGLSTWDKPQLACLASRFPYGVRITTERLDRVARAERALHDLGFRQLRVRYHGEVARIELGPDEMPRMLEPGLRKTVSERVKAAGFTWVALDLQGYRTGSLNEVLTGTGRKDEDRG